MTHMTPILRVESCACRRVIVQLAGETEREALERHQQSPQHQAWRARRER